MGFQFSRGCRTDWPGRQEMRQWRLPNFILGMLICNFLCTEHFRMYRDSFNKKYYKIKSAGRILSFRPFDDPSHMAISFISARANWCVFHHPQRFDQLVCWKKLKCLTTERVFRTGTRCQLMDRRPRSATSCLGHNLSSSSYFVLGSNR